jgi:hypothetical protein
MLVGTTYRLWLSEVVLLSGVVRTPNPSSRQFFFCVSGYSSLRLNPFFLRMAGAYTKEKKYADDYMVVIT